MTNKEVCNFQAKEVIYKAFNSSNTCTQTLNLILLKLSKNHRCNFGRKMISKHRKMDLIVQFTGFKSDQQGRTERSGEKNGKCQIVTSAIGTTIKSKALESKFIETVINIKECGVATSAMVKELIGKIKEIINFAVNTLETGMKGCDMGEELFSLRMEIVTTGIGWLEDHMDKVE